MVWCVVKSEIPKTKLQNAGAETCLCLCACVVVVQGIVKPEMRSCTGVLVLPRKQKAERRTQKRQKRLVSCVSHLEVAEMR